MRDEQIARLRDFISPYRITDGSDFRLSDHDPADTGGLKSKKRSGAKKMLRRGVEWLAEEQGKLYADNSWSVLLAFQAMDAAGKDGTIKHVMSGVNPQGVRVTSYKSPSSEELDHDFMWRCMKNLPERGKIGIFNRSYYEEVLVVRVHQNYLAGQKIPAQFVTDDIWSQRYEDIVNIERYLARNGCLILKFFLNVSREAQKARFMDRLDNPDKNWKFSSADIRERGYWDEYMKAYEEMIRNTSTPEAPWHVIPADNKWFSRLAVAGTMVEAMDRLNLAYPTVGPEKLEELAAARQQLVAE